MPIKRKNNFLILLVLAALPAGLILAQAIKPICHDQTQIFYSYENGKIKYSISGLDKNSAFTLENKSVDYMKGVIDRLGKIGFSYAQCEGETPLKDYPPEIEPAAPEQSQNPLPADPSPSNTPPPLAQESIDPEDMPMPTPEPPDTQDQINPPLVKTDSFSSINKSATDFTLKGIVYSQDARKDFEYWFEYWPAKDPLKISRTKIHGFRHGDGYFEQNVRIEAKIPYFFRAAAKKTAGGDIAYGKDLPFPESAPSVITEDYALSGASQATFIASVWGEKNKPKNFETYFVWYPLSSPSSINSTPVRTKSGDGFFQDSISNIDPQNHIYCFKPIAKRVNSPAAGEGAVLCFPNMPLVATDDPKNITGASVLLKGHTSLYSKASYYIKFQWGRRADGLNREIALGLKQGAADFSAPLSGLSSNEEYCFRAVAWSIVNGQSRENSGETKCFRTASASIISGCTKNAIDKRPVTLKAITDMAKKISETIKIRPAFLVAIFSQETNLGRNTGQCYSNNPVGSPHFFPGNSICSNARQFIRLCGDLGLEYSKMPFSCCAQQCGGAVGFMQFLPCVWEEYKANVAYQTKHNPPSPWNLCDSLIASALKLSSQGASKLTKNGEIEASARYFGCAYASYWECFYSRDVLARAECIQEYIDTGKMVKSVAYQGAPHKCADLIFQ